LPKCFNVTPLHLAASQGFSKIIALLLDHGANINAQDKLGCTALHQSILNDQLSCIEILLKYNPDMKIVNNKQYSAYDLAMIEGNQRVIEVLNNYSSRMQLICDENN